MTDTTWEGEASEAPPVKKGMPKWLWFCGGGCLLALIAAGLIAFLAVRGIQKMVDPETQWAELAEVLPYDERPDYTIVGVPFMKFIPGFDGMWTLMVSNDTSGSIMVFSGGEVTADDLFDPEQNEVDFGQITGNMGQHDFEVGTITVQGRELRIARFRSHSTKLQLEEGAAGEAGAEQAPVEIGETGESGEKGKGFMSELAKAMKKSVGRVDLTREEDPDRVIVLEYAKQGTLERVSDEEIVEFLAPFQVGPDR